jgi:molybdenum cofactor sulfurtransferase
MTDFDQLRKDEFSRLDAAGQVYLDYTGAGLYAESLIRAHSDMLLQQTLGNPHSQNPSSLKSTEYVQAARRRVLDFFDADPADYEVIFTLNASGALKLVGESYPFEPGSRYILLADNHNSVNGIREFAAAKGADVRYLMLGDELRVSGIEDQLGGADAARPNLFAYPAQSNFTGVQHPLEWVGLAQQLGYDVLLDAAAFAPTNPLSLREVPADFVSLSFYKMFGYPTGVGALIARRAVLHKLRRPWFAGGTVRFVSAQNQTHLLHLSGEAFEDGTLNFLSIAAVPLGLDFLERAGIPAIHQHVMHYTDQVMDVLEGLHHSNGGPVVEIYGPKTSQGRGGTVSFNVLTADGQEIEVSSIEARASLADISLRTGCFCNPGAAEAAFQSEAVEAYQCFTDIDPVEFTLQQYAACMKNSAIGAVRVSVGIATNDQDITRFAEFMRTFVDWSPDRRAERSLPEIVGG